jgi:CDP-paratose 2-epimerase
MNRALITGGCGFIGSHLARSLLAEHWQLQIIDAGTRPGWERNLYALEDLAFGKRMNFHRMHTQNLWMLTNEDYAKRLLDVDVVFHLAGQVAVTKSLENPRADFDSNALGTLQLLDLVRKYRPDCPVIFASTNKVYGQISDDVSAVSETHPLDFRSPYACSKGAADQYVLDYARSFGLRTAVLRMSCVYGPGQFGCEDQGWLAWFTIAAVRGLPITVYGDGTQVRDVLFVEDCLSAWRKIAERLHSAPAGTGLLYNLGGGPERTISLRQAIDKLHHILKRKAIPVQFQPARVGDQHTYISDIRRIQQELDWEPIVSVDKGLRALVQWAQTNRTAFESLGC